MAKCQGEILLMLSYTRRARLVPVRPGHFSSWLKPALLLLLLTGGTWLHAATVSGTVKDPSGAVIAEAKIEITGADLVEPVVVFSDGLGKFASPDLRTGRYVVRIIKDGFDLRKRPSTYLKLLTFKLSSPLRGRRLASLFPGMLWRSQVPIHCIDNCARSDWVKPFASTISL